MQLFWPEDFLCTDLSSIFCLWYWTVESLYEIATAPTLSVFCHLSPATVCRDPSPRAEAKTVQITRPGQTHAILDAWQDLTQTWRNMTNIQTTRHNIPKPCQHKTLETGQKWKTGTAASASCTADYRRVARPHSMRLPSLSPKTVQTSMSHDVSAVLSLNRIQKNSNETQKLHIETHGAGLALSLNLIVAPAGLIDWLPNWSPVTNLTENTMVIWYNNESSEEMKGEENQHNSPQKKYWEIWRNDGKKRIPFEFQTRMLNAYSMFPSFCLILDLKTAWWISTNYNKVLQVQIQQSFQIPGCEGHGAPSRKELEHSAACNAWLPSNTVVGFDVLIEYGTGCLMKFRSFCQSAGC